MTGWTWDYVEWNIDLPRLTALNHQWQILPPIALQMARITGYLGFKNNVPQGSEENNQEIESLLGTMPSGKAPEIMSPEEFLSKLKNGK